VTPYLWLRGSDSNRWSDLGSGRRAQVPAPVRAMLVVMRGVLVQDRVQVPWPGYQHPVGDLRPCCSHPAFGIGVGRRRQQHPIQMIGTDVSG
jgi:hypothetical protein